MPRIRHAAARELCGRVKDYSPRCHPLSSVVACGSTPRVRHVAARCPVVAASCAVDSPHCRPWPPITADSPMFTSTSRTAT
eukprot:8886109-Pyramimonas_sp.AAC.1